MGYAVYEDRNARNLGVERWAGYGVPAVCDVADCTEVIDRGLAYMCEAHVEWVFDEDTEVEYPVADVGCEMFFCTEHSDQDSHEGSIPKPDTSKWNHHILTDESWQRWRDENPEKVARRKEA